MPLQKPKNKITNIAESIPYKVRYNTERRERRAAERSVIGFIPDLKEVVNGVVYTERWEDIDGYDGIYKISDFGRVKSFVSGVNKVCGKLLKPNIGERGYSYIMLYKDGKKANIQIHRLVAIEFLENKEKKHQVNHKNGIKSDNRLENLEWCTQSENMKHSLNTGLKIPLNGENCKVSKLTEEQVIEILTKKRDSNNKKNWGAKELCLKYNLKPSCVSEIASGRNWKHIKI